MWMSIKAINRSRQTKFICKQKFSLHAENTESWFITDSCTRLLVVADNTQILLVCDRIGLLFPLFSLRKLPQDVHYRLRTFDQLVVLRHPVPVDLLHKLALLGTFTTQLMHLFAGFGQVSSHRAIIKDDRRNLLQAFHVSQWIGQIARKTVQLTTKLLRHLCLHRLQGLLNGLGFLGHCSAQLNQILFFSSHVSERVSIVLPRFSFSRDWFWCVVTIAFIRCDFEASLPLVPLIFCSIAKWLLFCFTQLDFPIWRPGPTAIVFSWMKIWIYFICPRYLNSELTLTATYRGKSVNRLNGHNQSVGITIILSVAADKMWFHYSCTGCGLSVDEYLCHGKHVQVITLRSKYVENILNINVARPGDCSRCTKPEMHSAGQLWKVFAHWSCVRLVYRQKLQPEKAAMHDTGRVGCSRMWICIPEQIRRIGDTWESSPDGLFLWEGRRRFQWQQKFQFYLDLIAIIVQWGIRIDFW